MKLHGIMPTITNEVLQSMKKPIAAVVSETETKRNR
jgi:hypothetical protein